MDKKHMARFLLVWILNSLLFFVVNAYYSSNFVLGNSSYSKEMAAVIAGFLLTLLCRIAKSVLVKVKVQKKTRYGMFLFYFLVNSAAIWVLSRIAPVSGLGITSFHWALGVGLAVTLGQWLLRQLFKTTGLVSK